LAICANRCRSIGVATILDLVPADTPRAPVDEPAGARPFALNQIRARALAIGMRP
jgi:hypothetical protein